MKSDIAAGIYFLQLTLNHCVRMESLVVLGDDQVSQHVEGVPIRLNGH